MQKNNMANLQKDEAQEINDLVDITGNFGSWQKRVFLIAFFVIMPNSCHILVMTFFAPDIDHWCSRPPAYSNLTINQWKSLAIPPVKNKNDNATYSHCLIYKNITDSPSRVEQSNVTCTSWEYDNSFYTSTVVDEWDLVCGSDWLLSLSTTVVMAGFLFSVFICGQLSDRYGRRPIILTCIALSLLSGLACAFSTTFVMFIIFRFIIASGISGATTTSFVLLMESVGVDYRDVLGICFEFGWALGYIILPGLAWFIRDWSNLQLAITVPVALFFSLWWFLPESPRWLLSQNKAEQLQKELEKVLKLNNRQVSNLEGVVKRLINRENKDKEQPSKKQATFVNLLLTPNMRSKTLNIYFNWFVNSFVYYGLSLNTSNLGGNPFLNFFIAGAVEFPSYGASVFAIKYLGRRIPLMVTMVVGGLACFLTIPIQDEIYPTVVRNVGVGSSSTCARIGSMVAPFVKELGKATNQGVPLGIFGGLSIAAGLLILRLPETKNKPLPDTLEEGEKFGKKKYNSNVLREYWNKMTGKNLELERNNSSKHPQLEEYTTTKI
ncbi:organic cation transporter protein-like isoform X2 [Limulus polyphemus]|uniref:Organic cation transporter protein-like isoform X2 n=1 Tax=Limulus polyphemus TaxID=6850 RepID=A0ABM1S0C0_LIMPO|nr:organic cation transporter protein-like isoform X2 [Limulus polyphemus]